LITLVAVIVLILARYRRPGAEPARLFFLVGLTPTVAWILLCRLVAGSYYNQELSAFGEFIWPIVAIQDGSIGDRLITASLKTFREVFSVAVPAIILILLLAVAAIALRIDIRPRSRQDRAILAAAALTALLAVALNWSIGFIAARIMFHAVPPMLIIAGWLAARLAASGRPGRIACALILGSAATVSMLLPFASHHTYS
jgi:hypothetical protein